MNTDGFASGNGITASPDGGAGACAANQMRQGDQCVPTVAHCTDPGAPRCAPHGKCQDTTGVAVCACDAGYAAPTCATCASGFQDNHKDGTCLPDCGSAALKCMPHSKCVDTTGTAVCTCAVGYALEGGACVWRGGPKDPTFEKKPDVWIAEGGAVIDPTATGGADPGMVHFDSASICQTNGRVRQSFAMPAFADSEPFALRVSARAQSNHFFFGGGGIVVGMNRGFSSVNVGQQGTFLEQRVCLGERAYDGMVELVLQGDAGQACFAKMVAYDIDHAMIEPAADCPAPGTIPNPDFEGTGGWTSSGVGAEVATGVGTGGSRGGHIFTTTLCQGPALTGSISAPLKALANAAVTLSYKGTIGSAMSVTLGGSALADVKGTSTFQSLSTCVPEFAKGVVAPLVFALPYSSGVCANADVRDFVFDDLKIVSDPACPNPANLFDGGFEQESGVSHPWQLYSQPNVNAFAFVVTNAAQAHSGSAALEFGMGQNCASVSASQTITVPDPVGAAGPAVKFWYKLPTVVTASYTSTPGGPLAVAATYTQKTVCLDPKQIGRGVPFVLSGYGNGTGTCATTYATEVAFFDDVQVTTDPSCPAQ